MLKIFLRNKKQQIRNPQARSFPRSWDNHRCFRRACTCRKTIFIRRKMKNLGKKYKSWKKIFKKNGKNIQSSYRQYKKLVSLSRQNHKDTKLKEIVSSWRKIRYQNNWENLKTQGKVQSNKYQDWWKNQKFIVLLASDSQRTWMQFQKSLLNQKWRKAKAIEAKSIKKNWKVWEKCCLNRNKKTKNFMRISIQLNLK